MSDGQRPVPAGEQAGGQPVHGPPGGGRLPRSGVRIISSSDGWPAPAGERSRARWSRVRRILLMTGAFVLLGAVALAGTGFTWTPYPGSRGPAGGVAVAGASLGPPGASPAGGGAAETRDQRAARRRLERRLAGIGPRGTYIVIDSANNRLWVRRGDEILVDAVVSTGSGLVLRQVDADRSWTFDTPRGMHRIHRREEDPVWIKPDWAFLEEGEPVPGLLSERYDYGALGEYGLYFGDGYIIHGTLYENLLGRSVSHGCIRVGREDLRRVWQLAPLGTPVIVY